MALLQARLGSRADSAFARYIGLAPVKNFLQRAATAQADILIIQTTLTPTGRGDLLARDLRVLRTQGRHRIVPG